jgi:hypothetical protein
MHAQVLCVKLMKFTWLLEYWLLLKFKNFRILCIDCLYWCVTQVHFVKIIIGITQMYLVKTSVLSVYLMH